ncbi:MAG: alpha-ketoacid dehydrogenase subunit beta, partial [Actinomycetota bacterium]
MTQTNVVTAIHDALRDEMERDERVVVIGQDVGARGGVFRVTDGFLDAFGDGPVIDAPLAADRIGGGAGGVGRVGQGPR